MLRELRPFRAIVLVLVIASIALDLINGRFWTSDLRVYHDAAEALAHRGQVYGIAFGVLARDQGWSAGRAAIMSFTVFSGTSHPGVTGAHAAEKCFLTGTPHPERGGFRNGISLDQLAAESVGNHTRFPSLTLAMSSENNQTLSFTRSGAPAFSLAISSSSTSTSSQPRLIVSKA